MWAVQLLGYVPLQSAIEKGDKKMRNQLKMGYVEYEEIEKSRLEELEAAEEELEELEDRVAFLKNSAFFIFVFAIGVAVGLHL